MITHGTRRPIEAHPIEFTGSGAEYFRVWIVNVLLTIVTLGIYTPWARRRTAQYFYSHTHVAGSPLEFAAQQRKMVIGFLMMAALYLAYQIAAETGQDLATSLLLIGFVVLSPFLWASAMRFRLGATRWRGIRLAFTASWREVYAASWPVFAIAAIWAATLVGVRMLLPDSPAETSPNGVPMWLGRINGTMVAAVGVSVLLSLMCLIRLEYNYRSLLVRRARIGQQSGRWKPVYWDFVRVWLATLAFLIVSLFAASLLMALLVGGPLAALVPRNSGADLGAIFLLFIALTLGGILAFMIATLPVRAYREARMFQLVWNHIGVSHIARFKSSLRTAPFVWLRLRNMLWTLLTLGFYSPFAKVSEYAAKVESVTLHLKGGTDQLAGELVRQQGAFADAAADALGLDLIG